MLAGWIALSDCTTPVGTADQADLLSNGTFVLELVLPLVGPVVLLDHVHTDALSGKAVGFSLFHDPDRGLILMQRQGKRLLRHILPDALDGQSGLMRISFQWDVLARHWQLSADHMNGTPAAHVQGDDPVMWTVADMVAMCAAGQRHASVLWYGVTLRATPPLPHPWVGQRTPIDTPQGPVAAGLLRAGDLVTTQGAAPRRLTATRQVQVPGRGTFAPILLRAPYYGTTQDLLVSSEQAICLQGTSVEYLYGEDSVLAAAHHLADGIAAFADNRRAVLTGVLLHFGKPTLITANGCSMLTDATKDSTLPVRMLQRYEVTPLQAMQARSGLRPFA